jgi:hypothetical protein
MLFLGKGLENRDGTITIAKPSALGRNEVAEGE